MGHLYFLRRMNLQFSVITMRMLFVTFYMRMHAYCVVRPVSMGVDFVLDIKGTLKPGLLIYPAKSYFSVVTQKYRINDINIPH